MASALCSAATHVKKQRDQRECAGFNHVPVDKHGNKNGLSRVMFPNLMEIELSGRLGNNTYV